MTRLERFRQQLAGLEEKRRTLMRQGAYLQSMRLSDDIAEVRKLIEEAEVYEESCKGKPITELVTREELQRMNIVPMMIEAHLVADMLVEVCYNVIDTCRDHGLTDVNFVPQLKEIIDKANTFASFLTRLSPELCDLLTRNETLNASLHKKIIGYINQRLNAAYTPKK